MRIPQRFLGDVLASAPAPKTAPQYSHCQQWLSVLWAVASAWLFQCGPRPLKQATGVNTVPRGFVEWELCIDSKRCCQQRRAFCPDTWPHYFRVMWQEPSWRLFWGPAVFHMTSHTSHSLALISRRPFFFVRVSHANFQTLLPRSRLDDIRSHVGLTGKEQLWLFQVRLCHRDRANVNSWVTGLMAMAGSGVLIVAPRLWARVTEDHHHYSKGDLEMSSSERWWRSFVKSLRGT